MLEGKNIILGITGGIAAYKMTSLTRLLVKEGASVKIIMSPEAVQFVSPLVLSTLSNNEVLIHLHENNQWNNHIELATWADLMIIAPATANTIAKAAHGLSDSLLLATFLSKKSNILFVPAMDEDMWLNPITQQNIDILKSFHHDILPVGEGFLASGIEGKGRMLEPEEILLYIKEHYGRSKSLSSKKILITAGPTQESIDPVRFISNHSSGKMGVALAEVCYENGAEVTLILGPTDVKPIYKGIEVVSVITAEEMKITCDEYFKDTNILFMAAAVADYKPMTRSSQKIKKKDEELELKLCKNDDILKGLGLKKKEDQVIIGFALESENEIENALSKLKSKNLDFIVLNSLKDEGAGFGYETNQVTLINKKGDKFPSDLLSKKEIAKFILSHLFF